MSRFDPVPWMKEALKEAELALKLGEVPVGAVLVSSSGEELARGHNLVESNFDATAHAEMLCIREASSNFKKWRLADTRLIVTLEPCPMCLTALSLARVEEVYFGSSDPRLGAAGSLFDLSSHPNFPQKIKVFSGVLEQECSSLLKTFFQNLRV